MVEKSALICLYNVLGWKKWLKHINLDIRKEIFRGQLDFEYSYVLHRISEQRCFKGPNSPFTVLLLMLEWVFQQMQQSLFKCQWSVKISFKTHTEVFEGCWQVVMGSNYPHFLSTWEVKDKFYLHMWFSQDPGTTLTKNCFSLLQYQNTRQLFVSWHIFASVCNRCEEHKRRSNRNDWSVYSVGLEKWTSEGELTSSGLWFNFNFCINIVGLTEQLW
jgi:hypothetical protein